MCELEFLLNHLLLTLSYFILLRFVGLHRIVFRNIKISECGQRSWHQCICSHYLYVLLRRDQAPARRGFMIHKIEIHVAVRLMCDSGVNLFKPRFLE